MKKKIIAVMVLFMFVNVACAQVRFDSASTEPSYIEPGDNVEIFVKYHQGLSKRELYSKQTADGKGIPLNAKGDTIVTKIVPKDEATAEYITVKEGRRFIGELFAGESWTSTFEVYVAENAPPTDYTLTFTVLKADSEGAQEGDTILTEDISLTVRGSPKFSLTSEPEMDAGEKKQFDIDVRNVGAGVARDATITVNATYPLTTLKSASIYLGDMAGKSKKTATYDIFVDSTAEPKAYEIPVTVKYLDNSGAEKTVRDTLGVTVKGMPQVQVNLEESSEAAENREAKVSLGVVNKGFIEVKFLSMEVMESSSYEIVSKEKAYIGNLASDDFETEDFSVKFKEGAKGKVPLKVKVTYTEENNNHPVEDVFDVNVNVMSTAEYEQKHPTTDPTSQAVTVVAAVFGLIAGYFVLWLVLKVLGAVTGLIDRKIFRRS